MSKIQKPKECIECEKHRKVQQCPLHCLYLADKLKSEGKTFSFPQVSTNDKAFMSKH